MKTEKNAKNLIQTLSFTTINLIQTLETAQKTQITFYAASYVTAAQDTKAILATEDQKLLKAANNFVKTITYAQLQNELAQNT